MWIFDAQIAHLAIGLKDTRSMWYRHMEHSELPPRPSVGKHGPCLIQELYRPLEMRIVVDLALAAAARDAQLRPPE
jgi:hypothetical protein